MSERSVIVRERVKLLIQHFDSFLGTFNSAPPFKKYGQLELHSETIQRRQMIGNAAAAVGDSQFLQLLYKTLQAWGIGQRGSRLEPFDEFAKTIQLHMPAFDKLDRARLGDPTLEADGIASVLWQIISSLDIVRNKSKIVPCTKALHHILPELVVPIDRDYTGRFFGWHGREFQDFQERVFKLTFAHFVEIAGGANPERFVGTGWNTSSSKVIDNAIVGFCLFASRVKFPE